MAKSVVIADLHPYAEYQDSGVPWVGVIPSHWHILPNRALFYEINERGHADKEMLSVTITKGIIRQKSLLSDSSKKDSSRKDKSAYKLVTPNDIAYNKMRAWQGAIGVSEFLGIVSPAYVVMRLRDGKNHPRYYHNLFRIPRFAKEAERWSYGITSDMWSLRPEHFKLIYSVVPPPEEQDAIVRFLGWANSRLDRAIQAKRKVISLLNEQKQVIIHRAVTKGLNPSVPLKDSGISWIGDIPEHWETQRCGNLFSEIKDTGHSGDLLLSIDRFKGVIPQSQTGRRTRASVDRSAYKRVCVGQLAYNIMNAFMGSLGFSEYEGIVSPAYAVAQPRRVIEPKYFHELLRTRIYIGEYNCLSYGIMYERNRLYFDKFKLVQALIPPLEEQREIVQGIQQQTSGIISAIRRLEIETELIREYRTRLITDIVTGKLDVREAVMYLPEEADFEIVEDLGADPDELDIEGEEVEA